MLEIEPHEAHALYGTGIPFVDIRESYERVLGRISGSDLRPDGVDAFEHCLQRAQHESSGIVVCASGVRSAAVVRLLAKHQHEHWYSLAGGIQAWSQAGFPVECDTLLTEQQRERYSRQLQLPDVGVSGQVRLLQSRVLVVGAGGLGSPVILYLAAAGVGIIGIADDDDVELSNLHRQIVHDTSAIGEPKVSSAARRARELNPDVDARPMIQRVDADTIEELLDAQWDVIVDCSDNFDTRYLLSDAAVRRGIPVVYGSIYRTDGQVAVLALPTGPCYRCLYPTPPGPGLAPNCADAGVLGVLPGIIGSMQANETIKLLLGIESSLRGGLLLYDALVPRMEMVLVQRRPECQGCGDDSGRASG